MVQHSAIDHTGLTGVGDVAAHEADTTSVHGISNTANLYAAGGTDVAVADGGTGASSAATARSNLGALADTDAITYLDGTVAAAPATPAAGMLRIYAKTGDVLAVKDDAGNETVLGQGIADQGAFTFLDATEAAAPATPASGFARIYAKSDGRFYSMDDGGTEYGPFDAAGGGGGGPLLYVDSLAVGATGDEFADMSAWTATGSVTNTLVTTNVYDATIQRLVFTTVASTDRYTKAAPDADFTAYLTMYGADAEDMIGWGYVNTSGTGCGIAWRSGTVWSVAFSGWVFASSPTQVWQDPPDWPIAASPYLGSAAQFRIARSGSDIIVAVSYDGGSTWLAVHTFSGGSPSGSKLWLLGDFLNPSTYRLNVGRLTVV